MKRWGLAFALTTFGCSLSCVVADDRAAPVEPVQIGHVESALAQGPWAVVASLLPPQLNAHTATLLPDNARVLVIGGINALDSAQDKGYLFAHNAAKHTFDVRLAGKLVEPRHSHTATLLTTGKILVAGGEAVESRSTAEIVDTVLINSTLTAPMRDRRSRHGAVRLADGKVMVFGGKGLVAELSSAELFDPGTNTWSDLPPMVQGRAYPTGTPLADGKVLVVGGSRKGAELFDPATKTWTRVGDLTENRVGHVAALLPSGKVLVAGGFTELTGPSSALVTASAEVYDPATKAFTKLPPMPTPRGNATATVMPDGKVVVAGGRVELTPLNYVDVFDEKTGAWTSASPMVLPHALHTATLMSNGDLLVTGSAAGEVFTPLAPAAACTRGPDCGSGFCVDGVCCNAACTGSCERCDTSGAKGVCTAVSGAFNHCEPGNTCIQNKCVPSAGATCAADRLSELDKDGKVSKSCAPYLCDNGVGLCASACVTSVDCAPGNLCSDTKCVAAPSGGGDDSGGCAVTGNTGRSGSSARPEGSDDRPSRRARWAGAAALAALAGVLTRRRRR